MQRMLSMINNFVRKMLALTYSMHSKESFSIAKAYVISVFTSSVITGAFSVLLVFTLIYCLES